MKEEWRAVKGTDYQVSSLGRVRRKGKVLKAHPTNCGYLSVGIHGKQRSVHRIVAEAFLPGDGDVDHINGDKTDNRVENLERVSKSENNRRAVAQGQYVSHSGKTPVTGMFGNALITFNSITAAAKFVGKSHQLISIAASTGRTAAGVRWIYER